MIKKIIAAVSLFLGFIVTFAIGVGCIVRGAGDFSWDIVSEYVSMSDIVMINDSPISNLFSFSDHSALVGSHAEGQIPAPTNTGTINIQDIPANVTITTSEDEFIHFTFDGDIRESSVVKSADNLTGTNIPDIEFSYNESTDKATIQIKKLRTNSKATLKITIAIPASFGGTLAFNDVAGKVEGNLPLTLTKAWANDVAGKIDIVGLSAVELKISNTAGEVQFTNSQFPAVKISDSAGKVIVTGSIGYFDISDIAGRVTLESDIYLTKDCQIDDVMGTVDIQLPTGSLVNIKKSDITGLVTDSSSKDAEHTITVSDVMGKVSINS